MYHKSLKIEIACGEKTCASEPGKFCKFFGSTRMGTILVCILFPSDNRHSKFLNNCMTELFEDNDNNSKTFGWILRCDDCLNSEFNKK